MRMRKGNLKIRKSKNTESQKYRKPKIPYLLQYLLLLKSRLKNHIGILQNKIAQGAVYAVNILQPRPQKPRGYSECAMISSNLFNKLRAGHRDQNAMAMGIFNYSAIILQDGTLAFDDTPLHCHFAVRLQSGLRWIY